MIQTLTFFYHDDENRLLQYKIPIKETCPTTNLVTTETFELSIKLTSTCEKKVYKVYFTGNMKNENKYAYAHRLGQIFTTDKFLLLDVEWCEGFFKHGKIFFAGTRVINYDGEFYPTGKIKNGKLYRRFRDYDNKLVYEGSFDDCSRFHWHGIETFSNGSTYDGNYKKGKRHGHGILTYSNGSTYDGNYEKGKRHGHGILTYSNGNRYDGNWKDDEKHGHGILTYSNGITYDGNWKDDEKHGHGIETYSNGSTYTYDGNYKKGKRHGHGIIQKSSGYFFEGFFLDGLRHGAATELLHNGEKYIGNFKYGKRHGKGFLEFASGVSYKGSFENDHIHGQGIMFRKNNKIWKKGHFKGNDLQGKGIVFTNNGMIEQEGKFVHGKFFDETALMIQKYLDTRDPSVLNKITTKEIQKYIGTKFKTTYPVLKSKKYLLKQLIELSKASEEEHPVEENYDEFGNEIKTKCLGNDGNIYDIESMFYLFQQNETGEYTNIPYGYVQNQRMPNFPRMGNGKILDGYRILFDSDEDLVPPTLTRSNPDNLNINLISDDDSLFDDEELTEL